jgi:hypothetical protein
MAAGGATAKVGGGPAGLEKPPSPSSYYHISGRLAAYRHSPEGRDRARRDELMFKRRLSVDERDELDRLKAKYPPLAKAIGRRLAELRQRSR